MNDAEWELLLHTDQRKACSELVNTFANLVYAIAANKLGSVASREDIEDCVSDIFAEVLRCAPSYSANAGSMKAFISAIAKRRSIDAFRRISRLSVCTDSIDSDDFAMPAAPDNIEDAVDDDLMKHQLWEAVKGLGEPDSQIIFYQYFYCFKVSDIAGKLGMTPAAVQKRSLRAREKLRMVLEKR
jgi:RNA polymerase sigma-70 factor (ECF subfamily)